MENNNRAAGQLGIPPSSKPASPSESSPLLPKDSTNKEEAPTKWRKSVTYRVLLAGFLVSLSFGVTQVPLIYVFDVMTCEEYYKHHPAPNDGRCNIPPIEGSTARAVALLSGSSTLFGVANLFVTAWLIKSWGMKRACLVSIVWPALRLLVQNVGVETGAGLGIIIIQLSQVFNIFGGPAGYMLALNSFATEIVLPAERTSTIGRLNGCCMFGTALGYLVGGLLGDWFGIIAPFRVTLALFCVSTVYAYLALPYVPLSSSIGAAKKTPNSLGAFFQPLKMFVPRQWIARTGVARREYGVLLLGGGTFLAVLATGFIPILLQMYATDVLDFGATANSELVSLNFAIRATFLTFAFPAIITSGRCWLDKRKQNKRKGKRDFHRDNRHEDDGNTGPTSLEEAISTEVSVGVVNANQPDEGRRQSGKGEEENPSFDFDLLYTRYSLALDGILTSLAAFTWTGWQIYLVAIILPLGAGTGSAAKGTMLQMCTAEERTDALSAISLLELVAKLSSSSLFGLIFSALAEMGRPSLTFAVNGGVAFVGFLVLLFATFPPEGATRYTEVDESEEGR